MYCGLYNVCCVIDTIDRLRVYSIYGCVVLSVILTLIVYM